LRWANLGNQRSAWGWPYKSIKAAGGRIAFGSDWPVAPFNIGEGLYVTQKRLPNPPVPDQNLSAAEVIDGYTRDAAWAIHVEDRAVLAPGKTADLVIFKDDIFNGPLGYKAVTVSRTLLGGKTVYQVE
jgi:predicted amidohydrolase YtcJ